MSSRDFDQEFERAAPGTAYVVTRSALDDVGGDVRKLRFPDCPCLISWDKVTESFIVMRLADKAASNWVERLGRINDE